MARDRIGRRDAARLRFGDRRFDLPRGLALQIVPTGLRTKCLEPGQRIAGPFGFDFGLALVGLRILRAMAFEAGNRQPEQRGRAFGADVGDRLHDKARCLGRIGTVAVEDREARKAREIGGDVLARRLIFGRNRDSVAIVFDVDQQRQLLCCCNS